MNDMREKIIDAIDEEPEYPGEPPAELLELIQRAIDTEDVDLLVQIMRTTVRLTKDGIKDRILALLPAVEVEERCTHKGVIWNDAELADEKNEQIRESLCSSCRNGIKKRPAAKGDVEGARTTKGATLWLIVNEGERMSEETIYAIPCFISTQRKLIGQHCFGDCGKVIVGGLMSEWGEMAMCAQKECPHLEAQIDDEPFGEVKGKPVYLRKLKEESPEVKRVKGG